MSILDKMKTGRRGFLGLLGKTAVAAPLMAAAADTSPDFMTSGVDTTGLFRVRDARIYDWDWDGDDDYIEWSDGSNLKMPDAPLDVPNRKQGRGAPKSYIAGNPGSIPQAVQLAMLNALGQDEMPYFYPLIFM